MEIVQNYKMRCVIVIDGKSAEDLCAVGPVDLRNYFLPKELGVAVEDVASIHFEQNTRYDEETGIPVEVKRHKDNFKRETEQYDRREIDPCADRAQAHRTQRTVD